MMFARAQAGLGRRPFGVELLLTNAGRPWARLAGRLLLFLAASSSAICRTSPTCTPR
jgi:hypothetical protein